MLALSKAHRYFLYNRQTDMRNGFDGLSGIVRNEFLQNPLSGDIFIFINHRRTHIKLLQWQGDGFGIFYKRLEKGTYELPATNPEKKQVEITCQQLVLILEGIALLSVRKRVRFSTQKC